ncbi:MAG TPA: tetratricopeptide repeat protein [Gemmatimonadaceae bacterium]|nr:tetratricopeptide repeat protein [Gemmatimonadaceae bacterium]
MTRPSFAPSLSLRAPRRAAAGLLVLALAGPWLAAPAQQRQSSNTQLASAAPSRAALGVAAAPADSAITRLEAFLQRYPDSALRPNALFQLGELLVRRADERFAEQQRAGSQAAPTAAGDTSAAGRAAAAGPEGAIRPDYSAAIPRYEELVRRYPNFDKIDAAAYTLGTLYSFERRYPDAVRMFEIVAGRDSSRYQGESLFRLGDAYFEIASAQRGEPRRASFAKAASAYERATTKAAPQGDIYFLSLYKLGWSHYNQASQQNPDEYKKAVQTFGQLVEAYNKLSPEQQSRLGLRGEAIDYMAVAFTQVGGAEAANSYFASQPGGDSLKRPILRRVAQNLRDQGDYSRAVTAYQAIIQDSPNDSAALAAQREIVDIYQNRTLEPDKAQTARLALVDRYAPSSAWAQANPGQAAEAAKAREDALRQSAQYLLARAQGGQRASYGEAAQLYQRYLSEFASSDSARAVNGYYAEALFGTGDYARAGAEYSRAAYGYPASDSASRRAQQAAGQNAIVAFDSALVRNKTDRAAQDSLFAVVDKYVATFPETDVAKKALIQKGRRASESQRWDVMAATFRTYADKYPNDAYTPTAQKLIGDALYKQGQYAEAQTQWEAAQSVASRSGRSALADTIARLRTGAAGAFADTLIKQGQYRRAAEEVYVAFADKNPQNAKAPDALRDAIETYMIVVDSAKSKGLSDDDVKQARDRAIELTSRLVSQYPSYRYRLQYQNLNARLLAEAGRREDAVGALRSVIAATPKGKDQADAMVRLGVTLDSLGKKKEAAAAYEQFSAAYPSDPRSADAQYNAAVTYVEAGDSASAARSYATFAARYPRDQRAGQAREQRIVLLRAVGDTATATVELTRLCANPTSDAARSECAAQRAARLEASARGLFQTAVRTFETYRAEKLVIATRAQLTAAGVKRASARKQSLLRQLTSQFESTIKTGSPEYLAASTYYIGLAQYEYGNFLKNVQLPAGLTDEEQASARAGAERQAQASYDAAKNTWQALVTKADQDAALKGNAGAARWIDLARNAAQGNVEANPPAASSGGAGDE